MNHGHRPLPALAAIVVSHNSEAYVGRCVSALAPWVDELVVVDAGSEDASVEVVRGLAPQARVLELANVGYGSAANAGARATGAEYLLVTNADAWPLGDAVPLLRDRLEGDPRLAAVGPALESEDGVTQPSLIGFPSRWWTGAPAVTARPRRRRGRPLLERLSRARPTFLVGTAMAMRRHAFEEVGGFDEAFFMFNEDVELCWRLRRAGWVVDAEPSARFVHVGGASSGPDDAELYAEQIRGHLLFLEKHQGPRAAAQARRVLRLALEVRLRLDRVRAASYRKALAGLARPSAR